MTPKPRTPWWWVPSLYYAEGIPYIVAMTVSVIMYKTMGVSNTQLAFWTSVLYLPWVFKPLWSPFVDIYSTKRIWIVVMQLILGLGLAGIAVAIQLSWFFTATLILFWLIAFASATHDIACDGFYMLGLNEHQQSWFVGVRSTFYRFAMLTGQGLLIILAGYIESNTGLEPVNLKVKAIPFTEKAATTSADSMKISELSGDLRIVLFPEEVQLPLAYKPESIDSVNFYLVLSKQPEKNESIIVNFGRKSGSKDLNLITPGRIEFTSENWHVPVRQTVRVDRRLKSPDEAIFQATAGNTQLSWSLTFLLLGGMFFIFSVYHRNILPFPVEDIKRNNTDPLASFSKVFITFFQKKRIGAAIAFLLLYRFAESQLIKLASPFLLDSQEAGGLALSTGQVGFVYGTVGLAGLILGGLLGGFAAARDGLKKWIWWMALSINLPDIVYVFLSSVRPENFFIINLCVGIEQFGYGFGFTGYMLYMIFISEGEFKTSHFALTTGFMALGMMIPGMVSGFIQEWLGYQYFFIWVMIATIPSFFVIKFVYIDENFGKKSRNSVH